MYPFLPDSPFTIAYALVLGVALVLVIILGDRRALAIGAVMLADWLGTRAATAWGGEATALIAAGVDLSAAAALLFVPGKPAKFIAALFGAMLIFYGARDLQLIEYENMWVGADVLAYLQILLMVGAGVDGLRVRVAGRRGRGAAPIYDSWGMVRTAAAPSQRRDLAAGHEADR